MVYFIFGDLLVDVVWYYVFFFGFWVDYGVFGMGKEVVCRSLSFVVKFGMFMYNMLDYDKGEKKIYGKIGRILDLVFGLCY